MILIARSLLPMLVYTPRKYSGTSSFRWMELLIYRPEMLMSVADPVTEPSTHFGADTLSHNNVKNTKHELVLLLPIFTAASIHRDP